MYDRSSSVTDIDSVRLGMFARKQKSYDAIPPTSAALDYHTKLAAYQAGCIWGQAITMEILCPSERGGSSKITHGRLSGCHFHQLSRAASS